MADNFSSSVPPRVAIACWISAISSFTRFPAVPMSCNATEMSASLDSSPRAWSATADRTASSFCSNEPFSEATAWRSSANCCW